MRLGNFLKWKDNGSTFDVTIDLFCDRNFQNHILNGDIIGITLTSEILLDNCEGFNVLKNTDLKLILPERKIITHSHYMFGLSSFFLSIKKNKFNPGMNHISLICNNNFIHHINYLHEWQNWFKLITNQELEFKPELK